MSEFSHSLPIAVAADLAHATVANFTPASHDGLEVVERQAELLRHQTSVLPDGETVLHDNAVIVKRGGTLRLQSSSPNGHPAYAREIIVDWQGENTLVTQCWNDLVPATETEPESTSPRSTQLVIGSDELPGHDELGPDAQETMQGDLNTLSARLDSWSRAIAELRSRRNHPLPKQTWVGALCNRFVKLYR